MRDLKRLDRRKFMELSAFSAGALALSQNLRGDMPQNVAVDAVHQTDIRLTPQPRVVSGLKTLKLELGGTWNFTVEPPPKFWEDGVVPACRNQHIRVPSEWAMEGFSVPENGSAGYWRSVDVPAEWAGKRIKLRCDAAFSLAKVFINGNRIGEYEGGFIPFEFDVTNDVRPGKTATIALQIKQHTAAAKLSAMIPYAQHQLGGITRRIYLFAVPEVNIFRFQCETLFDDHYQNATLRLCLGVTNQTNSTVAGGKLGFSLTDPQGKQVSLAPAGVRIPMLRAGENKELNVDVPIARPLHWESEHPWLYTLAVNLVAGASVNETVVRRIGFRQVEVHVDQLLLNGKAIKLHGIERHETDPLLGRAERPEGSYRREVQLLKEANMNWVFTSHYPVPELFLDLCDEIGLLVTEELPFVWVGQPKYSPGGNTDPRYYNSMARIGATMLERDRSRTSIIFWQIGDECTWGQNFAALMSLVHALDSTRPVNFSYEASASDFLSKHYPKIADAEKVPAKGGRPVIYDQYAHVNNYNRRECLTDPGLRDYYGKEIAAMWDVMYANCGILGGAIWAWRDDIFYVPPSGFDRTRFKGFLDPTIARWKVGYGPWGIVDLWLRKKPEFWNVKKAYSPVRIQEKPPIQAAVSGILHIPVENRYDFTNLNELQIECTVGDWGSTATTDVRPRSKGVIEVRLPDAATDIRALTLKIFNKRELVDAYNLTIGNGNEEGDSQRTTGGRQEATPQLQQTANSILVRTQDFYWEFDRKTGLIVAGASALSASIIGGPFLAVTPLETQTCCPQIGGPVAPLQPAIMQWTASGVSAQMEGASVLIQITGHYPQYRGGYAIRVDGSGAISLHYRFEYNGPDLAAREVGLIFSIPADLKRLNWKHRTQWSYYPAGHIGRPEGAAHDFRNGPSWTKSVTDQAPPWPWELDETAGGTNDFRSTKYDLLWASLTGVEGRGIRVESDGRQNVRAWFEHDLLRLLITDFSNGGGEPLSCWVNAGGVQKTLGNGDIISGTIYLKLLDYSR